MRIPRTYIVIAVAVCVLLVIAGALFPYVWSNKRAIIQNEHVQRIIPLYHSLRKLPDILFFPVAVFAESELEKFELYISDKQLRKLNASLGENAFLSTLEPENKRWVKAEFRAGDYVDNVDVKYRGRMANHWNSYKKSYSIEFPKDNLFRGMREMRLIIPGDRAYFAESLNTYRAQKMGQVVPETSFVRLSVNGSAEGVMLMSEQWSQNMIEKMPLSALSGLFGVTEFTPPEFSAYSMRGLPYWKSWNIEGDSFPQMEALIQLVENTSDETFERIAPSLIDLESFYAKDVVHVLTGGYHASDNGNNIVLFFDATEGRFKTIPYNAGISTPNRPYIPSYPMLQMRIWNIPAFREARDEYFAEYVKQHKEDDIAYIDNWIDSMKREFYKDNAKLDNNFTFLNEIDLYRTTAIDHLENQTPAILDTHRATRTFATDSEALSFPDTYTHLRETSDTPLQFARKNPQFRVVGDELVLRGFHTLTKDVIIPRDTKLTIEAGTTLRLGEDVSIISYSPVTLAGTEKKPINITAQNDTKPWGSFVVLNTERSTSTITHTTFEGGSEERLQGVWFSGMLALHNADGIVEYSTFKNVQGEDAINSKGAHITLRNNTVDTTLSDGLDTDYVTADSIIDGNTFSNIGGDAIDISWTNAPVTNNTVTTCTDKGISVGERSRPTISSNTITGCDIGIAIKDQSVATIQNNSITGNRVAIAAYQKKDFFGGGEGQLYNNTLSDNTSQFYTDEVSVISVQEVLQ